MLREKVLFLSLLILVTVQHGSTSSSKIEPKSKLKDSGGLFEGDMILNKFQKRNLAFGARNGLIDKKYRWPKDKCGNVIVPYKFKNSTEFCEFLSNFYVFKYFFNRS